MCLQATGDAMKTTNNYAIQMQQAKKHFLTYDQETLIRKLGMKADSHYLYGVLFRQTYRICRTTGDTERWEIDRWVDGNSFSEVMTLLDLICDSREDRFVSGRWKNMGDFGLMFHQNLLENGHNPWAVLFQEHTEAFQRACEALSGEPVAYGDVAYCIEVFDGLPVMLQLWLGDDEFPPSLRLLWDENALMYLRYETMYYARGLLMERLKEKMDCSF